MPEVCDPHATEKEHRVAVAWPRSSRRGELNTRKQDILRASPPFFQNWFLCNSIIFNKILIKFNLMKWLAPEFHCYTPQPWAHPPAMCSDPSTRVLELLFCAQHSLTEGWKQRPHNAWAGQPGVTGSVPHSKALTKLNAIMTTGFQAGTHSRLCSPGTQS